MLKLEKRTNQFTTKKGEVIEIDAYYLIDSVSKLEYKISLPYDENMKTAFIIIFDTMIKNQEKNL